MKKAGKTTGKIAYSYIRFSTPKQTFGDSRRRQTAWAVEWCERNGYTLDNALNLADLGVSAFRGDNAEQGRLAAFVKAQAEGRVVPGSVLLVESLDRLSRNQIFEALELFLSIIRQGTEIITAMPEQRLNRDTINDPGTIMVAIATMIRAHEESATKSRRIGQAWENKRTNVKTKPLTGRCPGWLRLEGGKFVEVPQAVATVRRIFELTAGGVGRGAIVRQFNSEQYPTIGRVDTWYSSYIAKILTEKAVLGVFQPHMGTTGHRKPIGEPIPDYYPRIISDELYYAAQSAMAGRRTCAGRRGKGISNLFQGLIKDVRDGSTMTVVNKGKKSAGRQLVSTNARRAVSGSRYISFPYEAVERAILAVTNELTPDFFTPAADRAAVQKAEANLAEVEGRIAKIKNKLVDGDGADYSEQLEVLQRLVGKRRAWRAELDGLSAAQHTPAADNLEYTQQVIAQLDTLTGEELTALRGKLQSRFRTLIERIEMLTVAKGTRRRAYMHVHYQGGGLRLVVADVKNAKFVSSWGWSKQHDKPNRNFDFNTAKGIAEVEHLGTIWIPYGMSGKTK